MTRLRVVADHERSTTVASRIRARLLPARHATASALITAAAAVAPDAIGSTGRADDGTPVARLLAIGTSYQNMVAGIVETAVALSQRGPEPTG